MNTEPKSSVSRLVIDVVISLVFFCLACVFAGWAQSSLTPTLKWMYSFWFALGMLPCLIYLRFRGVAKFDNWDIVAFAPLPIIMGLVATFISQQVATFSFVIGVPICLGIRSFLPQSEKKSVPDEA